MSAKPEPPKISISDSARADGVWRKLAATVTNLQPSATLAINEHSAHLQQQGREIFHLALGQSPFPVPPWVVDELRKHAHQKAYLPVKGLPELRRAIAGFLHRTEGLDIHPDHVLVGPGTKELMFLLQLCYDAELIVPSPSWVSYAPQAGIIGRPVQWLQTEPATGLRVTPEALDQLCRQDPEKPRLLILNCPGNPTGYTYSSDQLKAIADVARRYGVLVLSDEIYSGLNFQNTHVSIARFYPEGTIVSNGLSKWCGAGGWRLGAFAFPAELAWLNEAMGAVASETYTSVSAPIQYAAIAGFNGGRKMDRYMAQSRWIMQSMMNFAWQKLTAAGALLEEPQGGFYVLPLFAGLGEKLKRQGKTVDSAEFCRQLLEDTGVAVLPGIDFGRHPDELSLRIAGVDFDGDKALKAAEGLAPTDQDPDDFVNQYCQPATRGIERLCDWVARKQV